MVSHHKRRGFTLLELVLVTLIIAIIAVAGAWMMFSLVQNSIFIPNQLNMDMVARRALDIMIDGDSSFRGLRFSKEITASANNSVTFIDQNNTQLSYTLDPLTHLLYRTQILGGGAGQNIYLIYYADENSGIRITGKDDRLFTYYDAADQLTDIPGAVRRIEIRLIAYTGSGSFDEWQGRSEQATSVKVGRLQ